MSGLNHPNMDNVVVDALIHMTMGVSHVEEANKNLGKDVHRLERLGARLEDSTNGGFMVHHIS